MLEFFFQIMHSLSPGGVGGVGGNFRVNEW